MKRACKMTSWAGALFLALASPALFAAGGATAPPAPDAPAMSPEQMAIDNYNAGLGLRAKAVELDGEIAAQADAKKRAKLEGKRRDLFEKAAKRYEAAIEMKPDFVQAHGSLGYALRRLGRFDEAMASYDTALALNPNYPEAIEYRGEALLGLGRLDDVKQAYQQLAMMSSDHAAALLAAVETWAAEPAHAEAAAAAGIADWAAAHGEVAATTGAGSQGGRQRWH
jgi:tetratricopeptide (TPR) repeat protein